MRIFEEKRMINRCHNPLLSMILEYKTYFFLVFFVLISYLA